MRLEYDYSDVPTLGRFTNCDARIRGILGPFRSGKSSASVAEIVYRSLNQKPGTDGIRRTRWLVVRNTFAQLEDSTIRTTHMWLPPQYFGRYNSTDHNYTIRAFENAEIEIWFRALDRPDHMRNLLSVEVTGAWINEAREVPWAIIDAIDGRIGQYPSKAMGGVTWTGMWLDTNPPDIDSKWYKFFEEAKHPPEFAQIFRQPSGLSPQAENLNNLPSPNYYKDLQRGKSAEWIKVYIHGQYGFVAEGKLIYPEYVDKVHCQDVEPQRGVRIIRGWDFGLTPSCVFSQVLPDGRWLTFDEMVSDNMSIDEFSDEVLLHCGRAFRGSVEYEDWGDPAGNERAQTDKRTCFEIMRAKNIMVEGSEQEPTLRQESVRKALRTPGPGWEPKFILHSRCRMLRKGFLGGYHRRRLQVAGPERYSEKPDKNQYCVPLRTEALTPSGWKRYSEISEGDLIYGFDMASARIVPTTVRTMNVFDGPCSTVVLQSEHASFETTSAHKHVAITRAGVRKLLTVDGLNDGHWLYCAASEHRPRKQRPFSDEFISLCAWIMAEGSYRLKDRAVLLCQSSAHNPDYCKYLDKILAKFPGVFTHKAAGKMRTWRITKETAWMVRHWMPNKVPSAEFIALMCNGNRRRFLYEFIRGDGHAGDNLPDPGDLSRAREFRPKSVTPRAFQKRADAVDALQMIAVLSGLRTTVRSAVHGYMLTVQAENEMFGIQGKSRMRSSCDGVWCPTTGTGTWVCRQDGQTFITGNSHPHDALQYSMVPYFGGGLTGSPPQDDYPQQLPSDEGRSSVTGY